MSAGPHAGQPLLTAGVALAEATNVLVLLHGRGASPEGIAPLATALGAHDFAVLAPRAAGAQWYPQRFTAPRAQNEPHLSSALSELGTLFDTVTERLPSEHVLIGGFSQGACLAAEFVARRGARVGGLLVFSGGLIGEGPSVSAELYEGADLGGTPVFIGCSDTDAHIPLERVKASTRVLNELGAAVTERIYPGIGHTITKDELEQGRGLVQRIRKR